ncbi:MAG: potassium transporter TrkG [Planctomycetota bacterium]
MLRAPNRDRRLQPIGEGRELTSYRRGFVALLLGALALMRMGFHEPLIEGWIIQIAETALLVLYAGLIVYGAARISQREHRREFLRVTRFEQFVILAGLCLCWWWPGLITAGVLLLLVNMTRLYLRLTQIALPPGLVFVSSFLGLIIVGTGLLTLPAATPADHPEYASITVTDAAFTITSAISQTGLVVRPTGEGFTRFGQIIILIWIQVGALGVIVFGALLASVMGKSFGLKATQTIAEGTEQGWAGQLSLQKLVAFIIVFTHVVELVGAVILYFSWPTEWPGMPDDFEGPLNRAYHAIFFSVSGFCNAGFVTTDGSMQGLRTHWLPHAVLAPMIVLCSIGFIVLDNIGRVVVAKIRGIHMDENGRLIRLSLNTKLILVTTLVLYLFGMLIIYIGEVTQAGVDPSVAVLDAHFMSINRTSGFDTIAPSEMGMLGQLMTIFLMFVGGSPGSVAGGVKLIAVAVMALTVWATIRGRLETTAFGRAIPDAFVRKCAAIVVMCLALCLVSAGVLVVTESTGDPSVDPAFREILFETVSAFGTTGLSLGITGSLSDAGKITIGITMFLGRVGVLAVVAALVATAAGKSVRREFPREEVVVY